MATLSFRKEENGKVKEPFSKCACLSLQHAIEQPGAIFASLYYTRAALLQLERQDQETVEFGEFQKHRATDFEAPKL